MMQPNPTLPESEREELLSLYQVTTQDLAFFKSQQWTLTNYALAAYVAIVGVPELFDVERATCATWALCAAVLAVAVSAAWVLWRLHGSIEERRSRLERIYGQLSQTFRDARGIKPSVSALEMMAVLWLFLAIGLGMSWWLLLA